MIRKPISFGRKPIKLSSPRWSESPTSTAANEDSMRNPHLSGERKRGGGPGHSKNGALLRGLSKSDFARRAGCHYSHMSRDSGPPGGEAPGFPGASSSVRQPVGSFEPRPS